VTFVRRFSLIVCVLLGFLAGMVLTGRLRSAEAPGEAIDTVALPAAQTAAPRPQAATPVSTPVAAMADFTEVAAQTVKAVTNISSLQYVQRQNSPFTNDPFFQYFFGNGDMFGERSRRELSLGSGVIVSADGYVLTNNHVIGQQGRGTVVTVSLADKREVRAQVVGVDDWTDIALLKLELRNLPVIPWGDSSKLKVAEWVLAIGNPFQLSQTVTLGIVSALGRANIGAAAYEDFIQTDAAINPGNSGGALINGRGELVGINTAIYSQTGGYQGVGFAVPSNLARRVMDDLVQYGEVRRGSIGPLETIPLTTRLAEELGVSIDRGAVVARMSRSGSAYQVGIRPGDVIVSLDGRPVDDPGQFLRMLSDAPIGSTIRIGVLRGDRREEFKVRVTQSEARRR
jgi:Do/DeqQ family serine protease